MCLIDGIERVDGFREGGYSARIFLGFEGEHKLTAFLAYPTNFPEMDERIIPEIQSVHREDAIEKLICIGNLIAARLSDLDQTLCDRIAIESLSHLYHCRRNVDTDDESLQGEFRCARERMAMAKTDF